MKNIELTVNESIATLEFDLKNEKVNKLSFKVLEELDGLIEEIKANNSLKALVIKSKKNGVFIAGADINEIKEFKSEKEVFEALKKGDKILNKIEALQIPTISYINGACMGGGLELALTTKYRVATSNIKTKLAFPEIKLGFFPGLGGTQRTPKLIGLIASLDLILTGKTIDAKKAFRLGLVDEYFDEGQEEYKLEDFIQKVIAGNIKRKSKRSLLEKIPFTRKIIFKKALANIQKKVNKEFQAPYIALETLKKTYNMPIEEGLNIEARNFAKLAVTKESKYMIELFFLSEKIKKDFQRTQNPIKKATVVGSGIMGKGIIWLFTKYLDEVRIKLRKLENAPAMIKDVAKLYDFFIKTRKMSKAQVDLYLSKMSYTQNYDGLENMDLAIEAIVEDEKQKTTTYQELEKNMHNNAIIATNTSSISIEKMVNSISNKENFLGIHFFNPVNKMPLVEIIPTKFTSHETINRTKEFLINTGKMPIVVNDCAGFLVNRILLPYLNEAGFILQEGSSIKTIDKVLKDFGMPMGPFILADTVGIDIGYHVAKILYDSYGERMAIAPILDKSFNELKLVGKKGGKGFYDYSNLNLDENKDIYKYKTSSREISKEEIINRCIFIMINEASLCLEEGIVLDADILDFAMIAGTGFPPYKGGLLKYANDIGIDKIIEEMKKLEYMFDARFKASNLLLKLQEKGLNFSTGGALWKH